MLSLPKLPEKPRAGLYIDDSNLYHRGKESGWMTDYKKLRRWVAQSNTIVHTRIYLGLPQYEPAKSATERMRFHFKRAGFSITAKELKKLHDENDPKGFKNKCNFDVEIHDEIMEDLKDLDIVYIATGDSDFARTKDKIFQKGKHVKFLAYLNGCASEIRYFSWHISLDSIRQFVERKNRAQGPVR